MRRLLICGDREWTNYHRILACLRKAHGTQAIDVVIEGEARGADKMGRAAAESLGIAVLPFPAHWSKFGKAAGPIRNRQQLKEGQPTEVWAFHNDIENSSGTADMVAVAIKAGLIVWLITDKACKRLL